MSGCPGNSNVTRMPSTEPMPRRPSGCRQASTGGISMTSVHASSPGHSRRETGHPLAEPANTSDLPNILRFPQLSETPHEQSNISTPCALPVVAPDNSGDLAIVVSGVDMAAEREERDKERDREIESLGKQLRETQEEVTAWKCKADQKDLTIRDLREEGHMLNAQIVDREQALADLKSRNYDAETELDNLRHSHAQVARNLAAKEEQVREMNSLRAERLEATRLEERSLDEQLRLQRERCVDLETRNRELLSDKECHLEERDSWRVRHHAQQQQADKLTMEMDQQKREFEKHVQELRQENRDLGLKAHENHTLYQNASEECRTLQDRLHQKERAYSVELQKKEAWLNEAKQDQQHKLEDVRRREQHVKESESALQQLRDEAAQREEAVRQREEALQDTAEKARKFGDLTKENKRLKTDMQEQGKLIWDLKKNLHDEMSVASYPTPGELGRILKDRQGDVCDANRSLTLKTANLEEDKKDLLREVEILREYVTKPDREAVRQRLACRFPGAGAAPEPAQEP